MQSLRSLLLPVLVGAALSVSSAFAGYVYEIEVSKGSASENMTMSVQDGNLKLTVPPLPDSPGGGTLIFRSGTNELFMVDDARKQYMKIDPAMIEQFTAAIEAQMQGMPEQQRQMMRRMMGGEFTPPSVELERTDQSREVAGYDTRHVIVKINGEKRSESWVADFGDVKGSREMASALSGMSDLFISFLEAMPMAAQQGAEDIVLFQQFEKMKGFPVASEEFENGQQTGSSRLVAVREEELGEFAPPSGYREQRMGM